ncbi:MAG: GspH/FimT family protein [Chromatiales bacterium]|nr:GspH/FimT family protein [Chromatiales bacterium]
MNAKGSVLRHTSSQHGFTLVELLVTVLLAVVFAAVAVPSFRALVTESQLTGKSNELVQSFLLARSEALKRGGSVRISAKADDGTWGQGWTVWQDADSDGEIDAAEIIQVSDSLSDSLTIVEENSAGGFTYLSNGLVNQAGRFSICRESGESGRSIRIGATGKAAVRADDCIAEEEEAS